MTSWPKRVSCRPMSMRDRPVTQLAEVDMKSASTKPMGDPVADAGSMSRAVPTAMSRANPRIDRRAGERSKRMDSRERISSFFMGLIVGFYSI
jgi:hypothetical protein